MSQIEYIGEGALVKIADILAHIKPQRVFLVSGKNSYVTSGARNVLEPLLARMEIIRFDDLSSLPVQEDVERGMTLYTASTPDLVIAVGGGHVMDVAKAINFLGARRPLIAIPTTAGSGAEATPFAVVYKNGTKTSLEDPAVLPTYAIVDPALCNSVPRDVALASGLDALAQGIESYWAKGATDESRRHATRALELVWHNIEPAIAGDRNAIAAMSEGAHSAGKAIAISKTTACHALSYGLTAKFGIPHGIAVAVTMPAMMRFNRTELSMSEITPEAVEHLFEKLEVRHAASRGVQEEDLSSLVDGVNPERLGNNPKVLTKEDIINIYTEAWNQYLN